tara:strand:+ start:70 stop:726 length:657 start_codon:yes stop_codon:yes gene_type:complete
MNVFGMRRSRLHLITLCLKNKLNYDYINDIGGGPYSPGNNNKDGDLIYEKVFSEYSNIKNKEKKIILFEDKFYKLNENENKKNIIIIRDFYDLLISRVKCMSDGKKYANIDEQFFITFKKILREVLNKDNNMKNKTIIDTDKFISDENYRENILKSLNINDYKYYKDDISMYGGGPSFKKNEKRDVLIPEKIKIMIKSDKELILLIKEYYKYDITEKI